MKNWWPVALLCTDYKPLSKVITTRLRKVMKQLIHLSQTCCVPGKLVTDNINLMWDILDFSRSFEIDVGLISMDQEKSFWQGWTSLLVANTRGFWVQSRSHSSDLGDVPGYGNGHFILPGYADDVTVCVTTLLFQFHKYKDFINSWVGEGEVTWLLVVRVEIEDHHPHLFTLWARKHDLEAHCDWLQLHTIMPLIS